jgi:GMP synthase (glutamine-hydrolysing)
LSVRQVQQEQEKLFGARRYETRQVDPLAPAFAGEEDGGVRMKPILIIKTGSTLASLRARQGDFEDWIVRGIGVDPVRCQIVDVQNREPLPPADCAAGAVITGSHDSVTDRAEWSERTAAWLRGAVEEELPVLGICYGHQLLAHALGGTIADNPRGHEFGTLDVTLNTSGLRDRLLGGLPNPVSVHLSHTQTVLALPPGSTPLAESAMDAHQAFRVGDRVWGVQFHPEFDAHVVRTYIQNDRARLLQEGQDPNHLLRTVRDTPYGDHILRRFLQIVDDEPLC